MCVLELVLEIARNNAVWAETDKVAVYSSVFVLLLARHVYMVHFSSLVSRRAWLVFLRAWALVSKKYCPVFSSRLMKLLVRFVASHKRSSAAFSLFR